MLLKNQQAIECLESRLTNHDSQIKICKLPEDVLRRHPRLSRQYLERKEILKSQCKSRCSGHMTAASLPVDNALYNSLWSFRLMFGSAYSSEYSNGKLNEQLHNPIRLTKQTASEMGCLKRFRKVLRLKANL